MVCKWTGLWSSNAEVMVNHMDNIQFRIESILLLKDIKKPNIFLIKIDLKDAFYSIPIAKN